MGGHGGESPVEIGKIFIEIFKLIKNTLNK
jgi:hypothetical protein